MIQDKNVQSPIHSGFNAQSTSWDVIKGIDLTGKTVIITGGYAGIGLETTKTLVSAGAQVIVPARDIEKARKNLSGVQNIEFELLDLMDPQSIDAFAEKFIASGKKLDLLINNAGIMWVPLRRDSRGIESQLATNYLGQFHLTARLWPALKKANGARVISVSSYGHQMAPFNFEDPNFEHREYQTLLGYGQSKTACNLFAVELDARGKAFNVRAYSVHPGSVYGTDLGREEPIDLFKQIGTHDEDGNIKPEVEARLKTIPQGAATTVWCATSPLLHDIGGVYCENCDIAEIDHGQIEHRFDDPATIRGVQSYSLDKQNAEHLWKLSEEMIGIPFNIG
ncbi:SDR family NAD(P)-dependent oxidoreductase [Chryseobacterium sp. PTM-20240506]|uniref:SDR family NAD(P)-dependent oxidoreductase n=1 Tax=unclassified Chryseobacterium TaxID=2593645 RepID=UPI002359619E|nr:MULTISPECIES: SDR family NAD(P)-dependent oxidoreductase [unclassified Chryseobacterium]MDC8103045.1 SDR family NAD(P)-dependent oxidoreductase [Chryseobacterium sp. B21-037]MDQ1802594.1 SDR family NAD(P)-dependent oxidoreductase [Chryseobacterium sp. CKR4-1]